MTSKYSKWTKSSRSGGDPQNCVEWSFSDTTDEIGLRDSKRGEHGPVLTFSRDEMAAFVQAVQDGELSV